MWGTPPRFLSTVIPSKRVLLTHLMADSPMIIGARDFVIFPLQMSIALLLPGWGVSLLVRHHKCNSLNAVLSLNLHN